MIPSWVPQSVFGNHQVLRHVNQTTSQVTGVRRFQCGIRQTFTSTVGGDEVLEYVQTFTEVRGDWRFDDGAIRFASDHAYQQADESVPQNHAHRSRPSCRCC